MPCPSRQKRPCPLRPCAAPSQSSLPPDPEHRDGGWESPLLNPFPAPLVQSSLRGAGRPACQRGEITTIKCKNPASSVASSVVCSTSTTKQGQGVVTNRCRHGATKKFRGGSQRGGTQQCWSKVCRARSLNADVMGKSSSCTGPMVMPDPGCISRAMVSGTAPPSAASASRPR